jgi:microsomal epoxide hydrolase
MAIGRRIGRYAVYVNQTKNLTGQRRCCPCWRMPDSARRLLRLTFILCAIAGNLPSLAQAQSVPGTQDRYFFTSDGVRLHYLESGPSLAPTLVLVPGWCMPAWIFAPQIVAFSRNYHVIAFDPRGQGESNIAPNGYNQTRRGEDIGELLQQLGPQPAVIIGWSLGVLDTLAYIHIEGDARIAGLVLVDNSVGENPPPRAEPYHPGPPMSRADSMYDFVSGMFETPQSPEYLNALTAATLRLPAHDAHELLEYPVPRSYWRQAIFSTDKPVLYIVRPHLAGQADNLLADRPDTQIAIYTGVGHALFVDAATRFNAQVTQFLATTVWPAVPPP